MSYQFEVNDNETEYTCDCGVTVEEHEVGKHVLDNHVEFDFIKAEKKE